MPHTVSLRTSHPGIQLLVGDWLADARFTLPQPVTLTIEVAPIPESAADSRPVFRQGRIAVRSGPPEDTLVLDWEPHLGRAVIAPNSSTAQVTIVEAGLEKPSELLRSFLLTVCILLVRRVGLHHVHGATLRDPCNRGWFLVGVSHSGKSTTTAMLARQGWGVGTDDIAFLTAGETAATTDVLAWRERLALHPDAVVSTGFEGGYSLGPRRKTGWFPEELGATWIDRVTPEFLVFPTVNAATSTRMVPMRAKEALSRLIQCSSWVVLDAGLADEHLGLMTTLVTQVRAFEATLGRDIFDRPGLLLELVA
jgi:hypothetical protein